MYSSCILPRINPKREALCAGQLIFVPSYFDYVRLRNLMKSEASDSLVGLCEYTEHSDAARGRTYFLQAGALGP